VSRRLLVAVFEPAPGAEPRADALLRAARGRAQAAGWHCWAYRNEIHPSEITLFIEGPRDDPSAGPAEPVFGEEIGGLRALSRRFEPVRSLVELPLEGQEP
jgi:hypothetical protein